MYNIDGLEGWFSAEYYLSKYGIQHNAITYAAKTRIIRSLDFIVLGKKITLFNENDVKIWKRLV